MICSFDARLFSLSVCLSGCPFLSTCVCSFLCQSIYPFVRSFHFIVCAYSFLCRYVCPFVIIFLRISIVLFVCVLVYVSVCLCVPSPLRLSVCVFVCFSICLSDCVNASPFLFPIVSFFLYYFVCAFAPCCEVLLRLDLSLYVALFA